MAKLGIEFVTADLPEGGATEADLKTIKACDGHFVFADLVRILAEADEQAGLEKNDFLEIEND